MGPDIFLAVLLGISQAVLAVLGIYVSLKPPPTTKHRWYIAAFILFGFAGVAVNVVQTNRNSVTQGSIQQRLDSIDGTTRELADNLKKYASPKEVETKPATPSPQETQKTEETTKSLQNIEQGITELKKRMGPQTWGLSAEQLVRLSRRIAPYTHPEEDRGDLITCVLGDAESTQFAVNLVAAFRSAGWNLPGSGFSQGIFSGNPVGLFVKIHSEDSRPPGLSELVVTLREAGIEPQGIVEASVPDDRFQIVIGHKPQ